MPTWTIFSHNEKRYAHPMQMNVFRVMKTAYHMLYPSKEPSTIEEISSQFQVASRESRDCRGSSEPPLARCITHPEEVLCLPCLEHQDSKRLEQCASCNSWCCAKDQLSCTGRPIGIESIDLLRGRQTKLHLMMAYASRWHARAHPPKPKSCLECELPDWRTCSNRTCWSVQICPECASCGVACFCQRVWACDLCAERADIFHPMSTLRPAVLHHLFLHLPMQEVSPREPVLRLCGRSARYRRGNASRSRLVMWGLCGRCAKA
ncbi:hypothetical protein EV702DRAFT_714514 [Suillus placidus]|uniref:Uncharacterized protein n=1 Tax=Suillus placidus TaxID=48579 RepID=A0A9P6ZK44_9AGAM|nr:hypothetical protein EV702DRAFT_714514 [Suillus placidus]